MFNLPEVASRVSDTFQALPSFNGPSMGQFNVGGLGPINFNTQTPGFTATRFPSLGPIQTRMPSLGPLQMPSGFLGPIGFGLQQNNAGPGIQLNGDGSNYTPPQPVVGGQPNAPSQTAGPYAPGVVESYIRHKAASLHIDPEIAVSAAQGEGLNNYVGDNNSSFGPYQLHMGSIAPGGNYVGGLGDTFKAETGLDPHDPSTWKDQVDWVLNGLANKKFDWSPWHGAAAKGITGTMGVGTYNGPVPEFMDNSQPKTNWEQTAEAQLANITGLPYHWGGHDPATGFDCSGFVSWVYGQQGIKLTPQTQSMYAETAPTNTPQPGDLVFFNMNTSDPHLQHVGIYMGNGQFINDTDYGGKSGVQVSNLSDWSTQHPEFRSVAMKLQ